jgi:hypothetical protein
MAWVWYRVCKGYLQPLVCKGLWHAVWLQLQCSCMKLHPYAYKMRQQCGEGPGGPGVVRTSHDLVVVSDCAGLGWMCRWWRWCWKVVTGVMTGDVL